MGDVGAPKPPRRYSTRRVHPTYTVEICPVCDFPEADGGYCPECGWMQPVPGWTPRASTRRARR
jgi:hypothetical protein